MPVFLEAPQLPVRHEMHPEVVSPYNNSCGLPRLCKITGIIIAQQALTAIKAGTEPHITLHLLGGRVMS